MALHEPTFVGNELSYVSECITSGWVSTAGAFVGRFETALAAACEARYATATMNGTAALHVALLALGVGRNDAVICPALTFVATANAIAYCGATPIFTDSSMETFGLCPDRLREFFSADCTIRDGRLVHAASGRRIAALLPVHLFGHPVALDELLSLADEHGIPVVEDATESLGSRYRSRAPGALGTIGVLSFNGNKIITSGGGGAVITNDEALAARVRHLATTARRDDRWQHDHDETGYNYRMPNLNAALAAAQLEQLGVFTQAKRKLAGLYRDLFADAPGIRFFDEQPWAESNFWLNAILLPGRAARDAMLDDANGRGIQVRPCWRLMCDLPMYRHCPTTGDLSAARDIEARLVNLPSSAKLTMDGGTAA